MDLEHPRAARRFGTVFKGFLSDTRGATAVEYGLIAAGIACAALIAILMTGESLDSLLGAASTVFETIVADSGF